MPFRFKSAYAVLSTAMYMSFSPYYVFFLGLAFVLLYLYLYNPNSRGSLLILLFGAPDCGGVWQCVDPRLPPSIFTIWFFCPVSSIEEYLFTFQLSWASYCTPSEENHLLWFSHPHQNVMPPSPGFRA